MSLSYSKRQAGRDCLALSGAGTAQADTNAGARTSANGEEGTVAETYSGEFYCVKCKAKREASGDVHVNDKGTRMAKAKCPECGTNLNRILGKA